MDKKHLPHPPSGSMPTLTTELVKMLITKLCSTSKLKKEGNPLQLVHLKSFRAYLPYSMESKNLYLRR
jgi:hypothetical protein